MTAAVILLHGLRTSATMWRHQVEALRNAGIPSIAVDLPGHGSRIGERFSLASAADTLASAVAKARSETCEKPYVVGFSLGGYIAIDWVAAHPDQVVGLLAASCGTTPTPVVMGGWRVLAAAIHLAPDRGRALNDFAVRLFVPSPGAEDVIAGGVALEVMQDVLRELPRLNPRRSLAGIREPVLFVNGAFDHVRIEAKRYLAATPNGRLITVPRATHMVSVTHPAEFTEAVLAGYADAVDTQSTPGTA